VRPERRLFLDASVWIAAAGSPTGGSALVLELCRHGHATAVTSRLVLLEAERNIRKKLGPEALLRFYELLGGIEASCGRSPPVARIIEMR